MKNEALAVDWLPEPSVHTESMDRALLVWLRKRGLSADYQEQRDQRLRKMEEILEEVEEV